MPKIVVHLTAALIFLAAGNCCAQQPDAERARDMSYWMRKKLELSKDLIGGLATADFDKLERSSRTLLTLSTIEGWIRSRKSKEYQQQLRVFERAARDLGKHARSENLDGATLAFTQMTLSCVACHKELRRRIAENK